jgi:hypothetical protein
MRLQSGTTRGEGSLQSSAFIVGAVGIHGDMTPIVPAGVAQIDAAEERQASVDHDELLMMGSARHGRVVHAEVETLVRQPVEIHSLQPLALPGEHDVEVPREKTHVQPRIALAQAVEEFQEANLGAGRRVRAAQQWDRAVELPSRNENRASCPPRGPVQRVIVIGGIDDHAGRLRLSRAPDVAPRPENPHGNAWCASSAPLPGVKANR